MMPEMKTPQYSENLSIKAANTMEHVSNRSSVMEGKMEKLTINWIIL